MASSRAESSSSTQLWAVDSEGVVHVLQDVGAWLSSVRSNEVLLGPAATKHAVDNWSGGAIDGRFDRVSCGAGGLVCAKRDKVLYIRRGVTYDNPLGTAWSKALCDARELAVGRECIVRRTNRDQLFVADSLDLSSTGSVFLPHWSTVPSCEAVETHQLFTLDSRDNLFLISPSSGEVHVCPSLTSGCPDDFHWRKLIEGPPAIKSQSLSLFSLIGWGKSNSKTGVFSSVAAGDGCLWCLGSTGREVFQLVLNYGKKRRRNNQPLQIKGSWKSFQLPEKDEVTMISADWTEIDTFCGVVRENRALVSYAVLQENSGRVEIPNPVGANQRWKSISVCTLPEPSLSSNSEENARKVNPTKSFPPIYPKLPPREDFDLCCEDGDCSFCRSAAQSVWTSGNSSSWLSDDEVTHSREEEEEEGGEGGVMVTCEEGLPTNQRRKPRSSGERGEGERKKRKREDGDTGEGERSKKPRVQLMDQLADVPFKLSSPSVHSHSLAHHQVDVEVPLRPEDIDRLFSYSFSLEREVRESQVPEEIEHFTSGYWTVNPPRKHFDD